MESISILAWVLIIMVVMLALVGIFVSWAVGGCVIEQCRQYRHEIYEERKLDTLLKKLED